MNSPFKKIVLKNGLRVVLIPEKDNPATTVLVLVEAGSKYETKNINGISHFLEHLCFKGTKKRPSALEIAGELDRIGSEYNAFTSQEWTGYYAKAQAKHNDLILETISDLYLNPIFNEKELEKEKGVVIEELNMYEDMPQRKVQDLFLELLYGDQPAGWDVGGKKEIIQKITRQNVLDYRGRHYVASATAVIVSGNFNPKTIMPKIEKHFAVIHNGKKSGKVAVVERQTKPEVLVKFKESDQTHLVLGCRAYNLFDKRKYALEILADILGGGMSSRLFQKVREELGAAYYVKADTDALTDHGTFSVSAGIEHSKIDIVIKAILGELVKISKGDITEKNLADAKEHLSGRMLLGLETSDALAMFYGGQEILEKEMKTPAEVAKAIAKVTKAEVVAVARDIFKNEKLNLAMIGPYREAGKFEEILKF